MNKASVLEKCNILHPQNVKFALCASEKENLGFL